MQSATFTGAVQGGQLHLEQPLGDFEGKQVQVTLITYDTLPDKANSPRASSEAELLEESGRIRAPARAAQTLTARIVSAGRQPPRIQAEKD